MNGQKYALDLRMRLECLAARLGAEAARAKISMEADGSVSTSWLRKFMAGQIPSPGIRVLDHVAAALDILEDSNA